MGLMGSPTRDLWSSGKDMRVLDPPLLMELCTPAQVLFSRKYGVSNIRFTHNINCVIYSSTKVRLINRFQP